VTFWRAGLERSLRAAAYTGLGLAFCVVLVMSSGGLANAAQPVTKAVYDKQLSALGKQFADDLNVALTQAPGTQSGSTYARNAQRRITKLQRQLGAMDRTLLAIPPPASIRSRHARLVAAVREVEAELTPIIAALRKGDAAPLGSISTLKGLKDVESAVKAIDAAGYPIGG
jgi:hypothetical protein